MTKERITATVDPDVAEFLSQDGVNASGLVNRLVEDEMAGTNEATVQMIQLRLEQVESECESIEQQLEAKERERERLETRLAELRQEQDSRIDEVRERIPEGFRNPDNEGIRTWAAKLDMTPEELVEELERGESDE
jgi:chromosome segregation ATPase